MTRSARRPGNLVAVSPTVDSHTNGPRFRLNSAYIAALENAGLVPFIAQPMTDPAMAGEILQVASGLVLTGGIDIDPALYGEARHPSVDDPSQLRDEWETALAAAAREAALPTLAICRGLQMMNVCLGGTLVQDIESLRPASLKHHDNARKERVHEVGIERGSLLAAIVAEQRVAVNSMHHQGVDKVAPQLRVTARANDGMIEALEWPRADWWMLAVQWHPEELIGDSEPWDRKIFSAFAAAVRA